jgi:exopolysaccharide biosynthesis polyprenyl glycosylphosphotransferase
MAVANQRESSISIRREDGSSRSSVAHPLRPFGYLGPTVAERPVAYASAKRALDVAVSLTLLILLIPVLAVVAALVRLTSRGPAIFRQTRVGAGGRPFTCYKFRSMCVDAENRRDKLLHLNEASGPVFKMRNDPRLTPIGKYLRKFSLDELPQLYNVLRGEMSLVGPRPPVPGEVVHYRPRDLCRLAIKPGLTCLWQIKGRSNIPFDRWVDLDLMYIESMSFWGDVSILVKTIPAVITGRGAR